MPVLRSEVLPPNINCPHCNANMDLDDQERSEKRFTCPACNRPIDLSVAGTSSRSQARRSPTGLGAPEANRTRVVEQDEDFCCSKCGSTIRYGDPKCSHCGEKLEYDELAFPDRVPKNMAKSNKGELALSLGILSILVLALGFLNSFCLLLGPILGIPAWVIGSRDLKKIRAGLTAANPKRDLVNPA